MDIDQAGLQAMIADAVAQALAEREAATAAAQIILDAAAAADEAEAASIEAAAEVARSAEQAAAEEAQRSALFADAFAGVLKAITVIIEIEHEAHRTRPLKVAIFDQSGRYIGCQEARADLIELHASDEYHRLTWRPEWDALREVRLPMTGPWLLTVLPIPNLANIPGGLEEAAGSFVAAQGAPV